MSRFMVMYETEHFSDGFEVKNLKEGLAHVEEILAGWITSEKEGWNGGPTNEQIDNWNFMIDNCEAYVFDTEWDGSPAPLTYGDGFYYIEGHYYLDPKLAELIGWREL